MQSTCHGATFEVIVVRSRNLLSLQFAVVFSQWSVQLTRSPTAKRCAMVNGMIPSHPQRWSLLAGFVDLPNNKRRDVQLLADMHVECVHTVQQTPLRNQPPNSRPCWTPTQRPIDKFTIHDRQELVDHMQLLWSWLHGPVKIGHSCCHSNGF